MSQSDNNRLHWFLSRVGQTIYSTAGIPVIKITSALHAKALSETVGVITSQGEVQYFDTKEEAEQFKNITP